MSQEIPEHVRRIIDRDGEIEFTPPSFEQWLGRLQMTRTLASMFAFLSTWLIAYGAGHPWESATVRGMIASIVAFFFAWAAGLFIFGEIYDAQVKAARVELEQKERERARRIEEYYRERLRAQGDSEGSPVPAGGAAPSYSSVPPLSAGPTPMDATTVMQPDYQRRAA